jgi:hypothetical protein
MCRKNEKMINVRKMKTISKRRKTERENVDKTAGASI